ncbi:MAG: FumA C-terminus/TtdB family hydratase beta subunit [Anaerolineales bacterium]
MEKLKLPISADTVRGLHVGDPVLLSGVMLTGRDAAHKWMIDTFIRKTRQPVGDDLLVYEAIKPLMAGGAIYHCGPVVAGLEDRQYRFVAAGPTTSTREEPYQGEVMEHFDLRAVIGKGGMGPKTLAACQQVPGVYLHAIGGAATLIAQSVANVLGVHKLDFGVPEAMWVIEVEDFPAVVTMDSHGESLHAEIETRSARQLEALLQS